MAREARTVGGRGYAHNLCSGEALDGQIYDQNEPEGPFAGSDALELSPCDVLSVGTESCAQGVLWVRESRD